MTILALCGSPQPDSAVSHLLRAVAAQAPSEANFILFEGILGLPLFSPTLDRPGMVLPATVAAWRQQVQAADALLIATPEYAFGMPGSLKNALDWLVSAGGVSHKPVGVLSASPNAQGGEKARTGVLLTLEALGAALVPAASFAVPQVRARLAENGTVLDHALAGQLRAAAVALVEAVHALK